MSVKNMKKVFILLFAGMLLVPMLLTNFTPNVESKIEKRMLANFPSFQDEAGNKNPNFLRDFENWFNDNVGLRQSLFEANSHVEYDLFNSSAIKKVTVGKEGWLYYTEGSNLEIAAGQYPGLEEKDLEILCKKQCLIRDVLAEQGIDYVLFLPPSKVSIYPEYIRGDFSVRETPVDLVADYLEAHSDLKVVRMKDSLLKEKETSDELLYFKTDTHWNAAGTYVAYKELVKKLNEWGLIDGGPTEVQLIREDTIRDLSKMLVTDYENYLENAYSAYEVLEPTATHVETGEIWQGIQDYVQKYDIYEGHYFVNKKQDQPSALVFADSMFMGWMQELLAENCSAMTGIRDCEIRQELIDLIHPDIVFSEITERSLNILGNYSADLIQTSAKVDKDTETMTVTFHDYGECPRMAFAVWSEKDDQDDLAWYEAERSDDMSWQITVDLNVHKDTEGIYNIHYYRYDSEDDPGSNMKMDQFDVGELFAKQ